MLNRGILRSGQVTALSTWVMACLLAGCGLANKDTCGTIGAVNSGAGESCDEAVDTANELLDAAASVLNGEPDMGTPESVAPPVCGGFYAEPSAGGMRTDLQPLRNCPAANAATPPLCWHLPCEPDSTNPVGQPGTVNCATGACDPTLAAGTSFESEVDFVRSTQATGDGAYGASDVATSPVGSAVTEANESKFHTAATYESCKIAVESGASTVSNCPAWNAAAVVNKGLDFEKIMLRRLAKQCAGTVRAQWRYRSVEARSLGVTKPAGRLRIADAFCPEGLDPGPAVGTMHEFKCLGSTVPGQKRQDGFRWQATDYVAKTNYARCAISHGEGRNVLDDGVFGGPVSNLNQRFAPIHLAYHFCADVPPWASDLLAAAVDGADEPAACANDTAFTVTGEAFVQVAVASPESGDVPSPPATPFTGMDGSASTDEICEFDYVADQPEENQAATTRFAEVPDVDFSCEGAMVPEGARDADCASEHYDRCDSGT